MPSPWWTSRRFWEGFTPAALAGEPTGPGLRTVFCAEGDWRPAEAEVIQAGDTACVALAGDGDLDAAAAQARRFLALDVDQRGWPEAGRRDPVIGDVQERLPGLRPCGFHSPTMPSAWSVLCSGYASCRPGPTWIFRAVKASTCERSPRQLSMGCLTVRRRAPWTPARPSGACSRSRGSAPSPPNWSWSAARTPPDALPRHKRRLDAKSAERYGPGRTLAEVPEAWRPYPTWAAVHLRALREQRTGEIAGR